MRLSVCAFYIRVEALYTLKHHPAESVTSDFFLADPTAWAAAGFDVNLGIITNNSRGSGGAAPQKLDGFACLSWLIVAVFAT